MNIQAKGQAFVDEEVKRLCEEIKRLGSQGADGKWFVNFGPLYDATQDIFEALAGTLKSAKKKGLIDYSAPILLKGPSDKIPIILLKEPEHV
jgi:hypothetical protein